jgi:predicted nucleic acid-binding protein
MNYLIDTDVLLDYLHGSGRETARFLRFRHEGMAISVITYGEIYEGFLSGFAREREYEEFLKFLKYARTLPLDVPIAVRWAELRDQLRRRGQPLKDADLLIAATALQHDLTLVTRNTGHFERVEGLRLR